MLHIVEQFARLLRDKDQRSKEQARSHREEWTGGPKHPKSPDEAFAVKLLQDTDAVVAAMILPYSQGQTEGRINKAKRVTRRFTGAESSIC